MGIKLTEASASGGTTDHSEEIAKMRSYTEEVMTQFPDASKTPGDVRRSATICMAAAALLEAHDQTGISLDNWDGPLELVFEAMWLIFKNREDFIPNGV